MNNRNKYLSETPMLDFHSPAVEELEAFICSPDELVREHHQTMSPLKAFLYRHLGRHLMNRNVRRLRGE